MRRRPVLDPVSGAFHAVRLGWATAPAAFDECLSFRGKENSDYDSFLRAGQSFGRGNL